MFAKGRLNVAIMLAGPNQLYVDEHDSRYILCFSCTLYIYIYAQGVLPYKYYWRLFKICIKCVRKFIRNNLSFIRCNFTIFYTLG